MSISITQYPPLNHRDELSSLSGFLRSSKEPEPFVGSADKDEEE